MIKKIAVATAIGFAIGTVMSLLLPAVAGVLGIPEAVGYMGNPLWTGSFFGLITGLTEASKPLSDFLLSTADSEKKDREREHAVNKNLETSLAMKTNPSPQIEAIEQAVDIPIAQPSRFYTKKLEEEAQKAADRRPSVAGL